MIPISWGPLIMKYDVAIIGAGPAGSAAAAVLSTKGASVLLVDKASFPRDKTCGGLITQKAVSLIAQDLNVKLSDDIILHRSNSFAIYSKRKLVNKATTDANTQFVSRRDLDNRLVEAAADAGACIIFGKRPRITSPKNIRIELDHYSYDYLIGADGVYSCVRRSIGVNLKKTHIALGLQVNVPVIDKCGLVDVTTPNIYFDYIKYGWGWVFPKGDYFSIGIAGLINNARRMREIFAAFLENLEIPSSKYSTRVSGAMIPYGTYLLTPGSNNVLLAGDAAGFVDPITGEGIYYALLSGVLAAKSIAEQPDNALHYYSKLCQEKILRILKQGLLSRFFFFQNPFHKYVLIKFSKNRNHIIRFAKVLSGDLDYAQYFTKTLKAKFIDI